MEIGRASANIKPAPQEVRIPGKKDFGFSYESRLFVTSAEEGSIAAESLMPGDEIVLVSGYLVVTIKTQPVGCYTEVVCLYSGTCISIVVTLGTQPVDCYREVVCLYSRTCI